MEVMGLALTRLLTVWLARARRRLPSRSSSERTLASSESSRDSLTESTSFDNESFPLQTREIPILDGGCPISALPQDLLLRLVYEFTIHVYIHTYLKAKH